MEGHNKERDLMDPERTKGITWVPLRKERF